MKVFLLFIGLMFVVGCLQLESKSEPATSTQAPPLKVFGQAEIVGKVRAVDRALVEIIVLEVTDYIPQEPGIDLVQQGDSIIMHFTGVGNIKDWKIQQLAEGTIFSVGTRCLDGRINSQEEFTKEKCYWEVNEESVVVG